MKTILVIGQKYNDWTILKYEGVDQKRRRRYLCRCKCGEEKSLVASAVYAGRTKQCSKCKALDIVGQEFFDWTVIARAGTDKHQKSLWLCRCKCGKESIVSGGNLTKGTSKRCFDCGHNVFRGTVEIPPAWWIKQQRQAFLRGIEWNITESEIVELMKRQENKCALTDLPLLFSPMTISIDRIDSDGCYEINNVQLVHKHLNIMKHRYEQGYFILMCRLVAEKHQRSEKGLDTILD